MGSAVRLWRGTPKHPLPPHTGPCSLLEEDKGTAGGAEPVWAEVTGVVGIHLRWTLGQRQLAGASLDMASLEAKGKPAQFMLLGTPPYGPGLWVPGREERDRLAGRCPS